MSEQMRFEDRMSDADALMWTIEKDPLLRSTITSVSVLDSSPDRARFVEQVNRLTRTDPKVGRWSLRRRTASSLVSGGLRVPPAASPDRFC